MTMLLLNDVEFCLLFLFHILYGSCFIFNTLPSYVTVLQGAKIRFIAHLIIVFVYLRLSAYKCLNIFKLYFILILPGQFEISVLAAIFMKS